MGLLLAAAINNCIIRSCDLVRLATRFLDPTGGVGFIEFENSILDSVAVCAGRTVASTVIILFLLAIFVEVEVIDGQVGVVVRARVVRVRVMWVPNTAVAATVGTRVDTRRRAGPLLEQFCIILPHLDRGTTRVICTLLGRCRNNRSPTSK